MIPWLFSILVTIIGLGWFWFYVVRPILEAYNLIEPLECVKGIENEPRGIMSNDNGKVSPSRRPSLETDGGRTETMAQTPRLTEDQLLTLYGLMRAENLTREKAAQILKVARIPMNNNLWARAASDKGDALTPIAGRRTRASYYPDEPDLEYRPPE